MTIFGGRENYRKTLTEIDSEMHDDDIKNLKFLSVPFIPKKFHTKFTSGLEIFEALEKCKKISEDNVLLLIEILDVIGRVDLSVMLKEKAGMQGHRVVHGKYMDPFYILLFKLSEELTGEELQSLRYQYGKVPKREQTVMGIDLFSFMLQHLDLSPTKLNSLECLLESIHRNDLVSDIKDYTNKHMKQGKCTWSLGSNINDQETSIEALRPEIYIEVQPTLFFTNSQEDDSLSFCEQHPTEESMEMYDQPAQRSDEGQWALKTTIPGNSTPHQEMNAGISLRNVSLIDTERLEDLTQSCRMATQPRVVTETNPENSLRQVDLTDLEHAEDVTQYYKMNSNPRGICLIIDNQIFNCSSDDVEATHLGNRVGSEKDCEALQETFRKLHFVVEVRKNLTHYEMSDIMKEISMFNHSTYDCFVCCILSHGGEGFVFGTNGRRYRIKELINQFSAQNCRTLAGKPKLFFLQACRGKNHRPANVAPALETDAPSPVPEDEDLLPPEADFLLGYATVSDAVSYRSKSTGTFYISELTRAINKFADKEDILRILTRVNHEVSRLVYAPGSGEDRIVYKQIPAPQYTLRKVVKFL